MTTRPRRHLTETRNCEYCGNQFEALLTRIREGRGRFCSVRCANYHRAESKENKYIGYENACCTFDKAKQAYYVYWIDPETMKRKTTTYAKWWWENNKGEIPVGYRASYVDGNSLNICPENICIKSPQEFGLDIANRMIGRELPFETRKKISIAHSGGDEWEGFKYDKKPRYSGFTKKLKLWIKERDNYSCQVCGRDVQNYPCRIHHINGNKEDQDENNLILVCNDCHSLIHCKKESFDEITTFRSLLE